MKSPFSEAHGLQRQDSKIGYSQEGRMENGGALTMLGRIKLFFKQVIACDVELNIQLKATKQYKAVIIQVGGYYKHLKPFLLKLNSPPYSDLHLYEALFLVPLKISYCWETCWI